MNLLPRVLFAAVAPLVLPAWAGPAYEVVSLGPGRAVAVNDHVDVVILREGRVFLWTEETGPLDIGSPGPGDLSVEGMNDRGEIVGWRLMDGSDFESVMWTRDRGWFSPWGDGRALDINNRGEVVGWTGHPWYPLDPVVWTEVSGLAELETRGIVGGAAAGINDRGDIVGWQGERRWNSRAVLWQGNDKIVDLVPITSESDGGDERRACSVAVGINGREEIIGIQEACYPVWYPRGFFRGRKGQRLPLAPSDGVYNEPLRLNAAGEAVGVINPNKPALSSGFLWNRQDGMIDLATVIDDTIIAYDINGRGEIAGECGGGACLLRPVED